MHVKLYRSSGTLSHLFAQGSVAAETFVKDEAFRQRLNHKLPAQIKLKNAADRPDVESNRIVYAVATNKSIPDELPFFSKVTLRNAVKNLRALGYGVHLTAIEVDPDLLAKKKYKPKKPK